MTTLRRLAVLFATLVSSSAARAADWTERFEIKGDFRYRNEWSITRPDGEDLRWRQRIRARLGITGTVVEDQLWAGVRLRTGDPTDANSPHQTLGSAFQSFALNLDRANLHWKPGAGDHSIWAGKFAHPFANTTVYSAFIWDEDVNPDGVAAELSLVRVEDGVAWSLLPTAYLLLEQEPGTTDGGFDTDDGYLFAAQSNLGLPLGEGSLTIANAFYALPDATPGDNAALLEFNEGNAVNDSGTEYISDFMIIDNVVNAGLKLGADEQALNLSARFLVNLGADSENIGWQAGLAVPLEVGKVGIEPYVDVHAMQREAFYSDLIGDEHQADIGYLGGVAGLGVSPHKRVEVNAWGIFDVPDEPGADDPGVFSRVRLDLNTRF